MQKHESTATVPTSEFADAIPAELCSVEGGGTFAEIGAALDAGIDKLYKLQNDIENFPYELAFYLAMHT
jgi:hypothetical protein